MPGTVAPGPVTNAELTREQAQGITRVQAEPRLSYTLSNQVTVDVFARYLSSESLTGRIPATSNLTGGFNFRVSFSN